MFVACRRAANSLTVVGAVCWRASVNDVGNRRTWDEALMGQF